MAGNSNLHDSLKNKQDEFYTEISMIENELKHYRAHFKNKVVLCNCDDPYESNFFKYFVLNFNILGLKKLICTCFNGSSVAGTQMSLFDEEETPIAAGVAYKIELSRVEDRNGDGSISLKDVELILNDKKTAPVKLKGNGDFRSDECVKLLKQADIIVTNPPFSLFREYIAQLVENEKEFLIVGRMTAVTYKEILPLFMNNKVWLGYNSGHFWFKVPDYYEEKPTDFKIDENGQKWRRMGNICWFTNLDYKERHEDLVLYKHYSPEEYPTYDNYNAIDISNVKDIPLDYYGVMGVPTTFLSKWNPDQFIVLGSSRYHDGNTNADDINFINGVGKFTRILIQRKESQDEN